MIGRYFVLGVVVGTLPTYWVENKGFADKWSKTDRSISRALVANKPK